MFWSGRLQPSGAARTTAALLLVTGALTAGLAAEPQSVSPRVTATRATLDQYCVTCHNQRLKTGGLALDALDVANVPANAESWEKVVRKLRLGVMPPVGSRRPDRATYDTLIESLER